MLLFLARSELTNNLIANDRKALLMGSWRLGPLTKNVRDTQGADQQPQHKYHDRQR
jgi:hypothetical protein